MNSPLVTCVIPTTGRTSLARAIASVNAQTVDVKTVVVLDRPDNYEFVSKVLSAFSDTDLKVTAGGQGANFARNLGASSTTSPWIAFLDDDDWWAPNKLEVQLDDARDQASDKIIGASAFWFHRSRNVKQVPRRKFDPAIADAASYVALRPSAFFGATALQTSSMVVTRSLHDKVLWDENLRRHDDWDYFARATRFDGSGFSWSDTPLVHVQQGSAGSLSRSGDLQASRDFLARHSPYMSDRAIGDFVSTQVLRKALAQRNWTDALASTKELMQHRPHLAALLVGVSGIAR